MKVQARTPVGRIVQGGVDLRPKQDNNRQPVLDKDGNPVMECFIALAIPKNDPEWPAFKQQLDSTAAINFPNKHINGLLKPGVRFATKVQDGDGVDTNGDPVSGKEGFAGHWVVKMATRFAPRCFPAGRYDPASEMQNPGQHIKCGHYIRCGVVIDGNGVEDGNNAAVQGLFISPNVIEYVGIGEEITSGPSAADIFGGAPVAALPVGARPVGNIATPGNPQALPAATSLPPSTGTPSLPAATAAPALPGLPAPALPGLPPPQPAAPTYGPGPQMPAGVTVEAALATAGYTPEMLIQAGYIVRTN